MILSKRLTRFGLVAAVAALMLTLSIAVAGTVTSAQTPPATLYGKGLKAGDKVEASIGGAVCGTATATAAGEWSLQIAADNTCKPTAGAAVALKLNGAAVTARPAATWAGGGLPSDVANGYVLSAAPAAAAVTPPKTGNAGMLGSSATSMWLVLGIGLVALGAVAGTRAYASRGR